MRPVFLMIKCDLGKAYDVANALVDTIEEVSEVYSTSGQYDLLAKFNLEDGQDIGRFVCEQVQVVPHIKDTFTLISFKVFTG
ncbi:Lrp/AsnC family transcriptional regulator [Govanella unica]|uniref:Lrp/AsnC ligand binding domain-containing protein n=1 Tax=Govanella unica TaxID=2975056 RepID=A0A9X3Z7B4_9PROT|nr:Lrp/AsnC ligand binding domain-containing protein [Govania unica]MDA5193996.1 Lrp/AsnC ligand binding domain-containing protein [Govania unica]